MFQITLMFCLTIGFLEASKVAKPKSCTFPFHYKGSTYNECIKIDAAHYWCSVYEIYNGTFSFCEEDKSDQITDEHFYELIKKSQDAVLRLDKLKSTLSNKNNQCSQCIAMIKTISATITDQTALYMDQNKRLLGLREQHLQLEKVIDQIKQYYQRRRCKQAYSGIEYLGRVATTASGFQCQNWTSQFPNKHEFTESDRYSDNDIKLAHNYCRNPSQDVSPWCYITNSKLQKTWEYCVIPECDIDCRINEKEQSGLPLCDSYPSSKCPSGSLFYNNYCYRKYETPMTFENAEKTCVEGGGHLTSINSAAENNFVAKTVYPGNDVFYIGVNDINTEGRFESPDGKPANFLKFYPGEPNNYGNEDCVQVGRYPAVRESWNDISCSSKFGFVCKFKPTPVE